MKQKITQIIFGLSLLLTPIIAQPVLVSADCPDDGSSKSQVLQGVGQGGSDCSDAQVDTTAKAAVNILSFAIGIASVIVIILAGFRYVLANGDSGKIGQAKSALIYALVGVFIAAIAQTLVRFVLWHTGT